jgi:heavy metal efflux system protein
MLERIIAATLRQRGLIVFASLALVAFGGWAYLTLPLDAFPDVTNIQVEIVSHADGLSALEIERDVTYPIEQSMRGLPGLEQMRSVTKFGLSIVTLVFKDNVDIYFARQLVFERLGEARESVPAGVEVAMGPIATAMGEIYQYTLEAQLPGAPDAKRTALTDLRTVQDWVVSPQLKSVAGVNEINSFGGYLKQYQVTISPEKMAGHGVTPEDVVVAIGKNNRNSGGNILERHADQFIVRGVGLIGSIEDIRAIVLKSHNGIPTCLRDVATVQAGEAVRMGAAVKDGKDEAVGGIVMMLRGENSREVVERVKAKVAEINGNNLLPPGVRIVPYYDRSDVVGASVATVSAALFEGGILVVVVLFLLLRSVRASMVVLIALPLALCMTFIVMKAVGLSANLMSLGGLAISIGMIIDATIIQVENVQRHLNETGAGRSAGAVVLQSVLEVRKPSIFGELIIALTFIPILSLEGIEGKMFGPLAQTVAVALLSSLLLSIAVIPVLCHVVLRPQAEVSGGVMDRVKRAYTPLLERAVKRRSTLLVVAGSLLVAALLMLRMIGTEFIPTMDEGAFDADVALLPGVSLSRALEVNEHVARKLKTFPELGTVVARIGQTGVALDTRGVDKTGYVGILRPRTEWTRSWTREELTDAMRDSLASIPGVAFSFSQPIQCRIDELVAGTKAQLILKLFGEDIDVLRAKADEITRILSSIDGSADLIAERVTGQPYINATIDRGKIARLGVSISDVQNTIEIAVAGKTASHFYEQNRSFAIVVRLPEEERNSANALSNVLIPLPGGGSIPLGQVADIREVEGPVQISRQDGVRRIGIEMNISGRDIGTFVAEAKQKIARNVQLPAGYYLTWGGQFENQERAMSRLLVIGPIAIGLILLLLFLTFRSLRLAFLVLSILPLALIGGVFSLYVSGQYLSVPASVGFIVLFGVAVLNGVVMVSHIAQLREEGLGQHEAVIRGSTDRLRPVLMTALIAIFSLVPMLFAGGAGSEVQKPLATVVVGGLISSTLLTLFVIPSLYAWFEAKGPGAKTP